MVLWKMRSLGKFYPSLGILHKLLMGLPFFCLTVTYGIYFSIKSLQFFVSGLDLKCQPLQVSDFIEKVSFNTHPFPQTSSHQIGNQQCSTPTHPTQSKSNPVVSELRKQANVKPTDINLQLSMIHFLKYF